MKANNKTILRLAVAAAFAGASVASYATVALDATVPAPVKFASELPTTGQVLDLLNGTTTGTTDLSFSAAPTNFTPSVGQNLQVSVTLSTGATFGNNPTLLCSTSTAAGVVLGAASGVLNLGGFGSNQAVFTLTQTAIVAQFTTSAMISTACTVSAADIILASGAHSSINASITYQYGTLSSGTVNGTLLTFGRGVTAYVVAGTPLVAGVSTGFTTFTNATNSGLTTASLGTVYYVGNGSARLDSTGLKISATDVITAAAASITFAGANGALAAGMTGGIYLVSALAASCTTAAIYASANGATSVTFGTTAGLTNVMLVTGAQACITVNGVATIPADSITATLNAAASGTVYPANTTMSANTLVNITHNGTTLIAPLVQTTTGYVSRFVITNNGGAAAYTITSVAEAGNTATLSGAALSGTVAANTTTVVDLPTLVTYTAGKPPRASLILTVAGTSANINGLYQIVNPTSGAVSNYVMVKQ